jgi:hypothetical protein
MEREIKKIRDQYEERLENLRELKEAVERKLEAELAKNQEDEETGKHMLILFVVWLLLPTQQ